MSNRRTRKETEHEEPEQYISYSKDAQDHNFEDSRTDLVL